MTKQYFINEVNSWSELMDVCYDEGCNCCDDVYDDEAYDETIDNQIMDWLESESWRDVLARLNDLPTGYDYYTRDDWGEWHGVDNDFDVYKSDVFDWFEDNGYWEDEAQEDNQEDDYDDYGEDEPLEEEEISVAELFAVCKNKVQDAEKNKASEQQEKDAAFDTLCSSMDILITKR